MIADFVSLIFPRNCLSCDRSLISEEKHICTTCKIDLPFTDDNYNPSNPLYQKFSFESKVKSATSFLYFQRKGITQKILHELKYKGKKELGTLMGKWFAPLLEDIKVDMLLPVPIHRKKLKKRTYNQSEQIALGIAEVLGFEMKPDLITRQIATESQTRKSKVDRWRNVGNVYSKCTEDLSGKSVLLVDDVITTGATAGMLCARLVESNVEEIHIVCLARGQ